MSLDPTECWYPSPRAIQYRCAVKSCAEEGSDAEGTWIEALRPHRDRPDLPATLPDDTDYGESAQLCLRETMYTGPDARKRCAIEAGASQLGTTTRDGLPGTHFRGIVDYTGYLGAFVRSTEIFVLEDPGEMRESDH